MPVYVIDTLKPKNGLDFPVVEAVDVAVEGYLNLADAVTHFATQSALAELTAAINVKADTADLTAATTSLQNQINNLITPVTQDAEVQNARIGADGTSYQTLKERLDGEFEETALTISEHAQSINIIDNEIYTSTNVNMGLTFNKFWDISGSVAELRDIQYWGASAVIPVSEGEIYTVYANQGSSHLTRIWTLCDDELNIIERAEDVYADRMIESTFVVPQGASKLVISSFDPSHSSSYYPHLRKRTSKFNAIATEITEINSEIEEIHSIINDSYDFIEQSVSISATRQFWDFRTGTAVLTPITGTEWIAVETPIPVQAGDIYQVVGNQGASHLVRIWIVVNDDMEVISTASDYYESPNEGTLYTETFAIPEGGTKLLLTTTRYPDPPYISLYKAEPKSNNAVQTIPQVLTVEEKTTARSNIEAAALSDIYDLVNQGVGVNTNIPYYWDFREGVAVLTEIYGSNWRAVSTPIDVKAGEKYRVVGNQGASPRVRIWIVTNDDMEVLATAEDHYESPNEGTLYAEDFTIPEGGTKLCLTTTTYVESPYITLYKYDIKKEYPLKGLKLSLLGDSISAYRGTIPEGNDYYYWGGNSGVNSPQQMWWSVLCSKTGMIPCVINAWSGSGITQLTDQAHANKVPMSDVSRCQALHNGDEYPDVILIAGGVNDYTLARQSSQVPSGWNGRIAPVNGNSFDETYAVMIRNIQEAYPNAVVIPLSTLFVLRGTDNGYTYVNGENLTQADYDDAIERVAKLMRVPFINVEKCGFNRYNFYPTFAEDSSETPTHPNARGQRVIGEFLADVLPQIIHAYTANVPEYVPPEPEPEPEE